MKRFLLVMIIIILALATGALFWLNRTKTQTGPAENPAAIQDKTMHWGAMVRAYGLNKPYAPYQKSQLDEQLNDLKDLGATDSRANWEADQTVNDDFVDLSLQKGLRPMMVLETEITGLTTQTAYQAGYNFANPIALRYKGKVPYYQLMNEASGSTIKDGFPGNKTSDYDSAKYAVFKELVRGMSNGVYDADPNAQRIISAHWEGVGVIDKLVADGIHFDIIGWDWYSDMGTSLVKTLDDGSTLDIVNYLKKYNKPFWIVEVNRREGTSDKKFTAQSDFLQALAGNLKFGSDVKGFFVFTLTDQCDSLDKPIGTMGLISLRKNTDGTCTVTGNKPAFATFQDIIKKNG